MTLSFLDAAFPAKTAPLSDDELNAQIAISRVETIPLRALLSLVAHFGSALRLLDATETVLEDLGLSRRHLKALAISRRSARDGGELKILRESGAEAISIQDSRYPERLKEIASPPLVLFSRGDLSLLENRALLAVVGSRSMTEYGAKVLEALIPPLVQAGVVIVSGLAIGVDAKSHEICLAEGGQAVGVQAQGVDRGYPACNQALSEKVASCGLLLSEFAVPPPYMGREMFPRRNRIVSGISDGVLVAEARVKSGSLVTAHFALAQNRAVFAVPGGIFQEMSSGCLRLVRDGAKPVACAADVLEDLCPAGTPLLAEAGAARPSRRVATDDFETPLERDVFVACRNRALTIDELVEMSGASVPSVTAVVTKMSLVGTLVEENDGRFRAEG